ncbi:MAG: site-specific DNA-methyltransferase [Desulfohalobiaceae bacterium]|nr:site-specific DNA-methyltransferase [Desulfohalobiaceae bacterium]
MQTSIQIKQGSAMDMRDISPQSINLIVTSPPYPMIEMWDSVFAQQDPEIKDNLDKGRGRQAFDGMHFLLDKAWLECDRVLKPGGIVCINIGDATRTINKDFQLYSNHSRILQYFLINGYAALPDILWRKQTNAPTKFMGSGTLPVGAYVTYEHEYILILRKGLRRQFQAESEKKLRRESAFFWEERNIWFSDIWQDIKGTSQLLLDKKTRERSGAFPFELAYRLICMYSIKGDWVLDPFAGTGTTMVAALTSARNGISVEIASQFNTEAEKLLEEVPEFATAYTRRRLNRHTEFVEKRTREKGPLKHTNVHYGFPVMTAQEPELLLNEVCDLQKEAEGEFTVTYDSRPGVCTEVSNRKKNSISPNDGNKDKEKKGMQNKQKMSRIKEVHQKLPFQES